MKKSVPNYSFHVRLYLTSILLMAGGFAVRSQNIDFGKSYINVTKGVNGGTVETGDTLEIRASLVVRSGTYDSCRYQDAVPSGTTFIPGSILVLTNEGKTYKQFTDVWGDDPGWISGSNVTIHMGFNASASPATAYRRGRVANTHKPSFYSNTCIMIASFRIVVTAATGNTFSTGGGNMTYKSGSNPVTTYTFPNNTVMVYSNYGICSNTIGTNTIGTEFNGTFGTGQPRNRGSSANVPPGYVYKMFTTNAPNDYSYGIANNTSTATNYSTLNTWAKPDGSSPTHRVFQVWDIIGDHTGAADPFAGNPAADTVANPNAGYMLVVNAAYRIDSSFQQTISGLCPGTYYEISCWIRNICSKCGCDSNGKGATSSTGPPYYIPTAAGDSSGVYPNITFEVDGVDYYTTGNILYTGQWVKKGFTFLTGPAQTSFTLKYFNNAPGGGGNDWALDDITVTTCSPTMVYTPSTTPIVCDSNILVLSDTVRCFFDNYVYYKWQRSTDGGLTWTDETAPFGPITPYWNGSEWEYVASYTIPPAQTQMGNNGDMYRLVTATTLSNLSNPDCSFADPVSIVTMQVIECGIPLKTQLLAFSGSVSGRQASLNWSTTSTPENEELWFDVEKSFDGLNFQPVHSIKGIQSQENQNQYHFTDPVLLADAAFYRIKLKSAFHQSIYSRTLRLTMLNNTDDLSMISVINPFDRQLQFDLYSPRPARLLVDLTDLTGKRVRFQAITAGQGVSKFQFDKTDALPQGIYFLRVTNGETSIQKRVLKQQEP